MPTAEEWGLSDSANLAEIWLDTGGREGESLAVKVKPTFLERLNYFVAKFPIYRTRQDVLRHAIYLGLGIMILHEDILGDMTFARACRAEMEIEHVAARDEQGQKWIDRGRQLLRTVKDPEEVSRLRELMAAQRDAMSPWYQREMDEVLR